MGLLPNKSGLAIGAVIGSVIGLLFARESGRSFRAKLANADTPQKKFEVVFQEYLKVGKDTLKEVESSNLAKELVIGGKEILSELRKRAKKEGGKAVEFAEKKAAEIIREVEKQAGKKAKKLVKKARSKAMKVKKTTKKVVQKTTKGAQKAIRKIRK